MYRELPASLHRVGAGWASRRHQQHLLALASNERDERGTATHVRRLRLVRRPDLPEVLKRERGDVEPGLDVAHAVLVARDERNVAGDSRARHAGDRRRVGPDDELAVAELVNGWYRGHDEAGSLQEVRGGSENEERCGQTEAKRTVGIPSLGCALGEVASSSHLHGPSTLNSSYSLPNSQ